MDKKIIDRLEDIRNRVIQAHKTFSTAAYNLAMAIDSLDEEFKDDLESYVKDADGFEPDDTIDSIIGEMETMIGYIQDLSEGAKWYLAEQNDEPITFEEFKALALAPKKQIADLIYEINEYRIFNSDSSLRYDVLKTGISKSFDDAKRTIWRHISDLGKQSCGMFYEIIERPLNNIGCNEFRYWLLDEYGKELECAYSVDEGHLYRGDETVRFRPGEIILFINRQYKTIEPCVVIESPYTISECWELNNRLKKECIENEEEYTKAVYEKNIEDKDCYQIYTLSGRKYEDCPPVSLLQASKPGNRRSLMPKISSEDYRSLKTWYDDYISKKSEK